MGLKQLVVDTLTSFNHFYFIPLFGFFAWYGLLFGLVGKWVADGGRSYPEYDENETPVPLERIGMILLPGFFIAFVFIHAFVFCASMYLEYYHRKIGKLIKFIKPTIQKRLAYASLILGAIAQIFLIAQAISGTVLVRRGHRKKSHYAVLLATFAILVMISLGLNFTNYYIMGQYYRKYVNGERWNKFTISFVLKITWLFVAATDAIICCVFYVKGKKDISSILEWIFHFWYGLLLAFWTYDLYPLTELRALRKQNPEKKSVARRISFWKREKSDMADVSHVVSVENLSALSELDSPGANYVHRYDNFE